MLLAFGAGMMLSGVIIYFYFGLTKTNYKATSSIALTSFCEVAIETIQNDLRNTWQVMKLRPDSLELRCLRNDAKIEPGFVSKKSNFVQVSYEIQKKDKMVALVRREGSVEFPVEILPNPDEIDPKIFTGYVMQLPKVATDPVPSYKFFDTVSQPSEDLPRIVMIGIRIAAKVSEDRMETRTKVHLPMALSNLVQGDYNLE